MVAVKRIFLVESVVVLGSFCYILSIFLLVLRSAGCFKK